MTFDLIYTKCINPDFDSMLLAKSFYQQGSYKQLEWECFKILRYSNFKLVYGHFLAISRYILTRICFNLDPNIAKRGHDNVGLKIKLRNCHKHNFWKVIVSTGFKQNVIMVQI